MYKALDIRDHSEIVILDQKWRRSINQLREFDRQDFLVCQGCKQPVRVRAGEQRRHHFAHKHLENCEYADESNMLRNSRAVLYEWLVSKFGENVTIEKRLDETDLFRPIDCWVKQDTDVFAYWIFDSILKPEKRLSLQNLSKRFGVQLHFVFVTNMLRTEQDHPDKLVLSTTEREFIRHSRYDTPYANTFSRANGSLHYLDAENRKLVTFRGLSLHHGPQIYKGHKITSELEKVLVSPLHGEFVHNGEFDTLQNYEKHIKASPFPQWDRVAFQRKAELFDQPLENQDLKRSYERKILHRLDRNPRAVSSPNSLFSKKGECKFCGKITDDWVSYIGKTGQCICRSCHEQGKS